jgi:hypothetical protein
MTIGKATIDACPRISDSLTLSRREADCSRRRSPAEQLNILKLLLVHPEIVTYFMDDGQADLFANLGLAGTDCLNILLISTT